MFTAVTAVFGALLNSGRNIQSETYNYNRGAIQANSQEQLYNSLKVIGPVLIIIVAVVVYYKYKN